MDSEIHKISPSQLRMYQQCPYSWYLAYVEKLKKKNNRKVFFEVGNYFHELAHVYYQAVKEGRKPGDQFLVNYMLSRVKRDITEANEGNIAILSTVSKMISVYVASWSPILDKGIEVLEVEYNIQAPVTLPSGSEVILNCITDLIYNTAGGKLTVRDHKTGKANSWNQYMIPLEQQLLFNSAAYYLLTGDMPLRVEISFINSYEYKNKQPTLKERFDSFSFVHNEHSILFYIDELKKTLDKMVTDSSPVRNYSKDCAKCQFNMICTQELRGHDTTSLKLAQFEKVERNYEVKLGVPRQISSESPDKNPDSNKEPFSLRLNV